MGGMYHRFLGVLTCLFLCAVPAVHGVGAGTSLRRRSRRPSKTAVSMCPQRNDRYSIRFATPERRG